MRLLSDAKESLTTAYAPKLRENFLRLICKATDGVYSVAIVSADFTTPAAQPEKWVTFQGVRAI